VPEISPVLLSMPKPLGRPLAVYDTVPPSASPPCICNDAFSPSMLDCAPGLANATWVTYQLKLWLALRPALSVAVTVTA